LNQNLNFETASNREIWVYSAPCAPVFDFLIHLVAGMPEKSGYDLRLPQYFHCQMKTIYMLSVISEKYTRKPQHIEL